MAQSLWLHLFSVVLSLGVLLTSAVTLSWSSPYFSLYHTELVSIIAAILTLAVWHPFAWYATRKSRMQHGIHLPNGTYPPIHRKRFVVLTTLLASVWASAGVLSTIKTAFIFHERGSYRFLTSDKAVANTIFTLAEAIVTTSAAVYCGKRRGVIREGWDAGQGR